MLRHRLRFGRLVAVYLALAFFCLIVGSLAGVGGAAHVIFAVGEWLLAILCPLVLVHYVASGILRIA